jgi:hypothetical protein
MREFVQDFGEVSEKNLDDEFKNIDDVNIIYFIFLMKKTSA